MVGSKLYVTTVSASPAPPFKFNVNVQPVREVVDLQARQQDTSALGAMNLARLVKDQLPDPRTTQGAPPRHFLADLIDVGFVGSDVAYDPTRPNFVSRAQGRLGYNLPSLYGLSLGAPYLHHGGAHTLAELFDDPKWKQHAEAGSAVWLHQGTPDDIAASKRDLINFLLSIDAITAVQDIPAGFDACPANEF